MLRCNNCGWSNESTDVRCAKCNVVLKGSMVGQSSDSASKEKSKSADEEYYPATERGKKPDSPYLDEYNTKNCPHCTYPNTYETKVCIKCNKSLTGDGEETSKADVHKKMQEGKAIRVVEGEGATGKSQPSEKTIDPYRQKKEIKCYIELLGEKEEDMELIECIGTKVALNRDALDPENLTITSKTQAVITYKNDEFYIEDKSEKQTTFVQVKNQHKLEDGDIILMGNRKFRFNKKS